MSTTKTGTGITAQALNDRLAELLAPTQLEVLDESWQHDGHPGADGTGFGTHFRVRIASPLFAGRPRVACHRLVYDALQDFVDRGLHALAIETSDLFSDSQENPMKPFFLSAVAAALLGLALPVLAQNVAIVNGKPVPKARVDALAAQLAKSGRPVGAEMQTQLKDEVIAREIFMQEAQKRGLDASDDFKAQMELARQTLLIRELFAAQQKTDPVTDADVKSEYDKFVAANGGKEYRARHILVEKEDEAKAIIASLKKGGKFDEIAKKQSKDPGSGANGGDLDWANASSYVPEFSGALVKLKKGQTTDVPVKSQFGWHVIRLEDVRDAQLPKLEEVKPQIAQQLQQQKLVKFQEELRGKAKIE